MTPAILRARIQAADAELAERFWRGDLIDDLLADRAAVFDELICELWRTALPDAAREQMAIYAVGGYGRGELHPGSDIDLLVLVRRRGQYTRELETFVQSLWDLGCEIGHSVRTVRECRREANSDLTIATALYERRRLTGGDRLDAALTRTMGSSRLWPSKKFFTAKRDEQIARHLAFEDVEYGLEPNIKSSPGGLRDIHTVLWILRRHFGTAHLETLLDKGVLTQQEHDWLVEGKRFLASIRYGLHLLAGRKEDRLQFEHQRELAHRFGYVDTDARRGVERFMQAYYGHVLALREVNDIVLQTLDENIIEGRRRPKVTRLNERFRLRNSNLETTHDAVFSEHPEALIEMFVLMAQRREATGVRASTIRSIRDHLHLIDDSFRSEPRVADLFLQLLRSPYLIVTQLTRMRRYGILGRYLPEFGRIVGQMQHDLFHIYTVDAHTMTVIGNMRRFRYSDSAASFPIAHDCVRRIEKIELLYISGLYHDIGKGRGGDHSTLGAVDARAFCERHGLNAADTDLVCWLVQQHLTMSTIAQRQDIHDPDVVADFAATVESRERLDYLYALTAADITATNPTLWNGWRASLLQHLYGATRSQLQDAVATIDREALIRERRAATIAGLMAAGIGEETLAATLELADDDFHLRYEPEDAATLLSACAAHDLKQGPLVLVRDLLPDQPSAGAANATEVLVHARDQRDLFHACVAALDRTGLTVHRANVLTASDGRCLNAFVVLDDDGDALASDDPRRAALPASVASSIAAFASKSSRPAQIGGGRLPRSLKQMATPTEATLTTKAGASSSRLTVVTTDRPGLLASIGALFASLGIAVQGARITTLGNRVEDVFDVRGTDGRPISDPAAVYEITNTIRQVLDRATRSRG
ncbi:MAG: [protein-PII] uridylyltransferase [Pseudomonadota bacterium]